MYIIDRERFLRAGSKKPGSDNFSDAIGLVVYSNRRITVDSFQSIFELLWNGHTIEELRERPDAEGIYWR